MKHYSLLSMLSPSPTQSYEFYVTWIYVGWGILIGSFLVAWWVAKCQNNFPVIW